MAPEHWLEQHRRLAYIFCVIWMLHLPAAGGLGPQVPLHLLSLPRPAAPAAGGYSISLFVNETVQRARMMALGKVNGSSSYVVYVGSSADVVSLGSSGKPPVSGVSLPSAMQHPMPAFLMQFPAPSDTPSGDGNSQYARRDDGLPAAECAGHPSWRGLYVWQFFCFAKSMLLYLTACLAYVPC